METRQGKYHSFMLRLWRGLTAGDAKWRASLEDPETGERHGFGDLQELFGFLEARTDEPGDAVNRSPGGPGKSSDA